MATAVVSGSGIAGILSAILLKRKFDTVYLIEKERRIGGLLNSFRNDAGVEFDYGTHFLRETGVPELDAILFDRMDRKKWLRLDYLKAGTFFLSKLNEKNPFINTCFLPEEVYQKGMIQLLGLDGVCDSYTNLEEQLKNTYGDVFTEHIFRPVLKKFVPHDLQELAPGAHGFFDLHRLVGLTPETTRVLKRSEIFDSKLGFHSYTEGISDFKKYYPVNGGIGHWVDLLSQKLSQLRINVITDHSVERIHHSQRWIDSVVLNDGTQLNCDQLVWTVPPFLCLRASGLNLPVRTSPPTRLIASLHHFVFNQPFLTDLYYFACFDPEFTTFRVTLYPSVQPVQTAETGYHLTVEVLSQEVPELDTTTNQVLQELQQMGVVPDTAKVLFQANDVIRGGFPVLTHQFVRDSQAQLDFARENLRNVLFLGKGIGTSFFMHDVLIETYNTLVDLIGSS